MWRQMEMCLAHPAISFYHFVLVEACAKNIITVIINYFYDYYTFLYNYFKGLVFHVTNNSMTPTEKYKDLKSSSFL